jgi:hypothetical protein
MGYLDDVKTPVNIICEVKPHTSSGTKEETKDRVPKITVFYISINILILNIMVSPYWISTNLYLRLN